ncbi:unnamed protein product (macronuclear) [Paramecium tetraurelia]|uniref:Chromosome undetermined scaffold_1, whole genome shotgun sequence n=1 Tax=Paramecium tetraurelia TaxID=5888 RepID=Q6BGH2_PARTE|nr:hypothetical protein [Paramecium tetraurelia strain d4-2]XP_001423465.1 uncharacterized protein GSPATT00000503001 [Paramecium tetraurelia]CAH03248.1 hypothetical protein with homology to Zn-dependent proteases [Paramecium tetraurelia]CAK56067.1 unnamed protein product [Paramecium tetraurelia]|eukprot:XP_001423465.1 hypothetical protein (macronuclear) [Paramecium tetraurelia strain d4-2]
MQLQSQQIEVVNKTEISQNLIKVEQQQTQKIILTNNQELMPQQNQLIKSELKPIGLLNLSLEKCINLQTIKSWIEIYLGLEVQILNLQLALYYERNNFYIYDIDNDQTYKLEKDDKDIINVFSIFKVMTQVKPKNISSFIAIVDQDIYDPYQPQANILGRAGNQRVCVVQVQTEVNDFYSTIVHELLHTLGFGHCQYSNCLMYANISTSMQLCEKHLQKLSHIKEIEELKRYRALLHISKQIGFQKEFQALEQIIKKVETQANSSMQMI